MKSRLIKNTIIATSGVLAQGAARFAVTMLVGRYFPERLGETSSILSLSQYITLFWPAPAGLAATRFLGQYTSSDDKHAGIISLLSRTVWLFTAGATLTTVPVAFFFSHDLATAIFSGLFVAAFGAYLFTRGALVGKGQVPKSTLLDVISSVATLLLLLTVLQAGLSSLLLMPLALGFGLYALLAWPRHRSVALPRATRAEVLSFTRHNIYGMIAAGGLLPATMILVQLFARDSSDLFAAALTLATPANLLAQSITQVLIPHFASVPATLSHERRRSMWQLFLISVAAFVAIFLTLVVLGPWLLEVVFPGKFAEGASTLGWLLAIVGAQSCAAVPTAILLASGRQKTYAGICFGATVSGTVTMALGIPLFGLAGALIGFAVGAVGSSAAICLTGLRPNVPDATQVHPAGQL
ncbi:UNVERIFIED_ORG: O-antigen/teichoic acid export membrane protein [Arthrobacter sp. UYEF10]